MNSEKLGLNRRQFIEYFAAIGIASAVMPACQPGDVEGKREITVETIEAAEKIAGIKLTVKEREKIVKQLNDNLKIYSGLREKKIDNSENSALVFNPIPPGMTFPSERNSFRHSVVEVKKPARIEDAAFFSVLQLAKLIKTKQITAIELTKMYLARLRKYNPKLEFVISSTEDLAFKQAKKADEEINSGKYRGPLHGIPYGVKDLLAVRGYKTTWGAEPYKDQVIDVDATVVERLEDAGAILIAKLTLGALARGDVWYGGKTRNPWDPEEGSSGSSAGSASATAAGCVAFSIGSETNGSIISPCDRCGVTGLRPTFGRVSRYGAMALSWSMDKIGPICRAAEDCAVVFHAIHGPDGRDNTLFDYPFNWDPTIDIKSLKIGFYEQYFTKELVKNPKDEKEKKIAREKQKLSNDALDVIRGLGVELFPIDVDIDVAETEFIFSTEAAAAFDELSRSDRDNQMKKSSRPDTFRHRRFVPAVEYIQANRYRTRLIEKMNKIFTDVDVIAEVTHSNTSLTNLTGHPAVVIPIGFVNGKPTSIVLTGKLFGEAEILAVAKAYQDVTDFHLKRPNL